MNNILETLLTESPKPLPFLSVEDVSAPKICGLLNGGGGRILFGVDKDFNVVGVDACKYVGQIQDLLHECFEKIEPRPVLHTNRFLLDNGKIIVILYVKAPSRYPVYYANDEGPFVYRLLEEGGYEALRDEEIETYPFGCGRVVYEEILLDRSYQSVRFHTLAAALGREELSLQDLVDLGLANKEGYLKSAALYFVDDDCRPAGRLLISRGEAIMPSADNGKELIKGNLFTLIQKARETLESINHPVRFLNADCAFDEGECYPIDSVIKAFAVALAHQDHFIQARGWKWKNEYLTLYVTPSVVRIVSPGNSKADVASNKLATPRFSRNPVITALLKKVGLLPEDEERALRELNKRYLGLREEHQPYFSAYDNLYMITLHSLGDSPYQFGPSEDGSFRLLFVTPKKGKHSHSEEILCACYERPHTLEEITALFSSFNSKNIEQETIVHLVNGGLLIHRDDTYQTNKEKVVQYH